MATTAEKIAEQFKGDGQCWKIADEAQEEGVLRFQDACEAAGAKTERHEDSTRHVFGDGSALVEKPGAWDFEGDEPFSWRGQ